MTLNEQQWWLRRGYAPTAASVDAMHTEPLGCMGLLDSARSSISRLTPREAFEAQKAGAIIIDV